MGGTFFVARGGVSCICQRPKLSAGVVLRGSLVGPLGQVFNRRWMPVIQQQDPSSRSGREDDPPAGSAPARGLHQVGLRGAAARNRRQHQHGSGRPSRAGVAHGGAAAAGVTPENETQWSATEHVWQRFDGGRAPARNALLRVRWFPRQYRAFSKARDTVVLHDQARRRERALGALLRRCGGERARRVER